MKVIVVGGGKVGYYLVKTLVSHGHEVSLIEQKRELCAHLADSLDIMVVCGDGSMIDVLESANTSDADAFVSVTGKDENNLIACQLAKKRFNVKRTFARVNNPKNADVLKRLGVDVPISSTDAIARLLEREIETETLRQLAFINNGRASLSELSVPENYSQNGVRLSELDMPADSIIVSIIRGEMLVIPRGNTQILSGDRVVVIAKNEVVHEVAEALGLERKH